VSTIKVNRIENVLGTKTFDLNNQPIYPLSSAWDGIALTTSTVPSLSDVGIIGDNSSAKIYPDGTIIGKSDNGNFIKYPNGVLECFGITVQLTTSILYGSVVASPELIVYMPILFIDANLISSSQRVSQVNYYGYSNIEPVGTDRISVRTYSGGSTGQGKVSWSVKGRWK